MIVRAAHVGDVGAVLPMVRALCAMHERLDQARYAMLPDVVERYERWLPQRATDPRSVFLVAERPSGGTVCGFLVSTIERSIPIYALEEYAFIHDVWVEPDARGSGAARAMTEEACRRFAALGVLQVRLETAAANEPARKLFASCGFRVATVDLLREIPP